MGKRDGERFKGLIDEPSIYNRALSAAEIQTIFASGSSGKCNFSCSYAINPTSATIPASGGSGSFTVETSANCPWSAVSNAGWITTNSSGTGNGIVNFTFQANNGVSRTGTISVGNQTFTITQPGSGIFTYNGHSYRLTTTARSWSEAEGEAVARFSSSTRNKTLKTITQASRGKLPSPMPTRICSSRRLALQPAEMPDSR